MSGKHTPGPWSWTDDNGPEFPKQWRIHPGVLMSDGTSGTPGGDEIDRANAALISAAPCLAEALADLLALVGDMHNEDFDEIKAAEAALVRARGDQP